MMSILITTTNQVKPKRGPTDDLPDTKNRDTPKLTLQETKRQRAARANSRWMDVKEEQKFALPEKKHKDEKEAQMLLDKEEKLRASEAKKEATRERRRERDRKRKRISNMTPVEVDEKIICEGVSVQDWRVVMWMG
jgi:hypothetical protein